MWCHNNNNKSRPVDPSSTPADVSTMTETGGDHHPGYCVHAGSGNGRSAARSQVSPISARLGLGGGGGGGGGGHGAARSQVSPISARLGGGGGGAVCAARRIHRFPRSRLGSAAAAAAVRFARHGAFTGFPDLGSARLGFGGGGSGGSGHGAVFVHSSPARPPGEVRE